MTSNRPRFTLIWAYFFWVVGLVLVVTTSALVVGWIFGFHSQLTRKYMPPFYFYFVPILVGYVGAKLVMRGRRLAIKASVSSLANDQRSPVLYLRSFEMDRKMATGGIHALFERLFPGFPGLNLITEEEQLIEILSAIGPVIAIGRPGEYLPLLGAKRIYITTDDWQKRVIELMLEARLVVIAYGSTAGLLWEIDRAHELLRPEQVLYLLPPAYVRARCGDRRRSASKGGVIGGFEYFTTNGEALLLPLTNRHWLCMNIIKPKVSSFKTTLQPVFAALSIAWRPPRVSVLNPLTGILVFFLAGFPLSLVVTGAWLYGVGVVDFYPSRPETLRPLQVLMRILRESICRKACL
jgi:hypothetical protein